MTNAKHTPGEWFDAEGMIKADVCGNVYPIASLAFVGAERTEANASLIASAPDLLAALSDLLAIEGLEGDRRFALNKAFSAIAKARGE